MARNFKVKVTGINEKGKRELLSTHKTRENAEKAYKGKKLWMYTKIFKITDIRIED